MGGIKRFSLVATESSSIVLFRCENFNVPAAAQDIMPARMGTNHLLVCPSKLKQGDLLRTLIANTVSVVQENFVFHFHGDSSILLRDMHRHGFMERSLPPIFDTLTFREVAECQK
jgi:hypothetical protein